LIRHPININPSIKFNLDKFKNNHQKAIIQIGQQMRYYKTIFEINIPKYRKIWLPGSEELCIRFKQQFSSSSINICHLNNYSDYDDLLSRNIVLCHLLDANANNTVLECIVRNMSIIINRHPAVVEYLGADYLLYFDSIDDIDDLVDIDLIEKAHNNLCSLDKAFINFETFTHRLFNIAYEVVTENKY